jgi:superfamily II DNA/RNA helicase
MQQNLTPIQADYLKNLSIAALNAMQQEVVEKAITGKNITLLAPTGSGKTVAFLIPLINKLKSDERNAQALIVVPSRELALQIEQVFRAMKTSFKVSVCYGGHSVRIEQSSLQEAPALIIGTPGRLADHIKRKSFDGRTIKMLVLDEFDKSLQMGFHEQMEIIVKSLGGKQQTILTSATKLEAFPDFLVLDRPITIDYLKDEAVSRLALKLVRTKSVDKVETLVKLVASFRQEVCLVFCNHRDAVERISALLTKNKLAHGMLHGAMEQIDREKNLIKFRSGAHNVLIATDLASRGLDIPEIKHVVHYQLPPKEESFIHRNGRTARMHAQGIAYLLLADDETLPDYIEKSIVEIKLNPKIEMPPPPAYACIYFGAGKKDKISKGDIVGLFTKKGGVKGDDLGLITTLDHSSYAAIKRNLVTTALANIKNEKLKGKKVKIEVAS